MAGALRHVLAGRQVDISHSESLEIVAAQFGLHDWNTLAARIADDPARATQASSNPGPIMFAAPVPIIRIFLVEKAMEFYVGFLGFTLDWEHRFGENFPLYAQVSRAGLQAPPQRASRRRLAGLGDVHPHDRHRRLPSGVAGP